MQQKFLRQILKMEWPKTMGNDKLYEKTNQELRSFKVKEQPSNSFDTYYTGAQGGYLKCSIPGTNNELQKRFYKFVHLQLSTVKQKFVHLKLFDVKFLFSKKYIFHKQKRTAVCGCASVFSDFKLTRENDDLSYSRHK